VNAAYTELFLCSMPALAICQSAGTKYPVIKEIPDNELPPFADALSRLPLYLRRDTVANLPH
jgi:hypothetical protein